MNQWICAYGRDLVLWSPTIIVFAMIIGAALMNAWNNGPGKAPF